MITNTNINQYSVKSYTCSLLILRQHHLFELFLGLCFVTPNVLQVRAANEFSCFWINRTRYLFIFLELVQEYARLAVSPDTLRPVLIRMIEERSVGTVLIRETFVLCRTPLLILAQWHDLSIELVRKDRHLHQYHHKEEESAADIRYIIVMLIMLPVNENIEFVTSDVNEYNQQKYEVKQNKQQKVLVVPDTQTVVDEGAVVVEQLRASVAELAMERCFRLYYLAVSAKTD